MVSGFIQNRPLVCEAGGFGDCGIVSRECSKGGELGSAISHAHLRVFPGYMVGQMDDICVFVFCIVHHALCPPICSLRSRVVDWYKDEQPILKVKTAIEDSLDADLPPSYDVPSFESKISLLLNHFIDMAIQGYGWIAA